VLIQHGPSIKMSSSYLIFYSCFFFSTVYRYLLQFRLSHWCSNSIQGRPSTALRNRGGDYIVPSQALVRNPNRRDLVPCEGDNNIVPPSIILFTHRCKGVRVKIDSKGYPCSHCSNSADGIYTSFELVSSLHYSFGTVNNIL